MSAFFNCTRLWNAWNSLTRYWHILTRFRRGTTANSIRFNVFIALLVVCPHYAARTYDCWLQWWKWVWTPLPAPPFLQSDVPRPKRTLFSVGTRVPRPTRYFYPWDTTSESEFGQNNNLTRNTGAVAKLKGAHRFLQGSRNFYRSHYFNVTLLPLLLRPFAGGGYWSLKRSLRWWVIVPNLVVVRL